MTEEKGYTGFVQLLDDYLAQNNEEFKKDATKSFHVSDMGKCLRMRYYKRSGEEGVPFEPRVLRIFEVGKIFHEYLQDVAKKKGVLIAKEERVAKGEFSGRYDALVQFGDKKVLLDFKTVHSDKFNFVASPKEEDKHYVRQLLTYVWLLQDKYPDLKEGRLVYISKDDLRIVEVAHTLTETWKKKLAKEITTLKKYWKSQVLPSKKPPAKWMCSYCQYRSLCFSKKRSGIIKKE